MEATPPTGADPGTASKPAPEATPARLVLDGSLTLRHAEALHARLRDALQSSGQTLEIDCTAAEEADLSGVQLLLAAQRSAATTGRRLTLLQPLAAPLQEVLRRGGFLAPAGAAPTGLSLWLQGGAMP